MKTFETILAAATKSINQIKSRSTWNKAVKIDALDFIEKLQEANEYSPIDPAVLCDRKKIETILLNGAENWEQYSWGGCALIYDDDIRAYYLTPSEQKKYKGNIIAGCHVLDMQARALYQAANIVCRCISEAANTTAID